MLWINKQHAVEECEDFNQCVLELATYDLYRDHGDKVTYNIEFQGLK